MFRKILIANRGEIAVRIARTAGAMGLRTVAVYSDADRGALHVAACDEAVHIGGAQPADSYLRGEVILEAAKAAGAEAIHPGYGFLSENPDFVAAVEAAGLTFVGPSAAAIRAMGLKDAAKALMQKAGVPVVPGYHGADQEPARLEVEAAEIGYPVLIKAVAGGGGKGMRRVEDAAHFIDALEAAKSEARTAFGNDAVLIEKFVEKPRHIEVQVFGDGTQAVHLFERDCSLQRRHQKVIEEAPAPGMTDDMRAAMGAAAVRAAEAIGYAGAGTVEFIVDGASGLRPDGFWFMEMNTRLQVEHPVTEAITGVDLVEWQLRVAAGEGLPADQTELGISGHAFEARLYAEDAAAGFLPATGHLTHLDFPTDIRVDTGVRAGDEITPFYDPMIAKIVVHGPSRAAALAQLTHALEETRVTGTVTNLEFLHRLSQHADFVAGDVDTGLIDRAVAELTAPHQASPEILALAALGALGLDRVPGALDGFHLWTSLQHPVTLRHRGEEHAAQAAALGGGHYSVAIAGERIGIHVSDQGFAVEGRSVPAQVVRHGASVSVFWAGGWHVEVVDPLTRLGDAGGGSGRIDAPMPGLVRAVFATPGAEVAEGDRLAILEAMKMEHVLRAPRSGQISEILVAEGDQVEAGAPLILMAEDVEASE